MKKTLLNRQFGFTLVEMMMVIAILGVVTGAVYSLYYTHQKAATFSVNVTDLQQNLQIGIQSFTKDVRMAGFLVPSGWVPIATAGTNSMSFNVATTKYDIAKIKVPQTGVADGPFNVDNGLVFSPGDKVIIIRPSSGPSLPGQPGGIVLTNPANIFTVAGTTASSVDLSGSTDDSSSNNYTYGDMIVFYETKTSTCGRYPTMWSYRVDTGSTCPTSQQCLVRYDPCNNTQVVAQDITKVTFSYYLDTDTLSSAGHDASYITYGTTGNVGSVRAIKIVLDGSVQTPDGTVVRSVESLIELRNRKSTSAN
jgi:prepilin-type N-terminal cleavage/methylation domain-containing protein